MLCTRHKGLEKNYLVLLNSGRLSCHPEFIGKETEVQRGKQLAQCHLTSQWLSWTLTQVIFLQRLGSRPISILGCLNKRNLRNHLNCWFPNRALQILSESLGPWGQRPWCDPAGGWYKSREHHQSVCFTHWLLRESPLEERIKWL